MDNRMQHPSEGSRRPSARPSRPVTAGGRQPPPRRPQPPRAAESARENAPQGKQPQRKQKNQNRWIRAILMNMATIAMCVFFAAFIIQSANDLFGLNQPNQQIEVSIPENATLTQIASILKKSGAVDQQLTFQLYASLKKDEKYFAGDYLFNSNMGYDQILTALRTEDATRETVTLYFVEGRNIYEIAQFLEEYKVCDAQEFLDYVDTADFGYEFMDQLPTSYLRFHRLEGYIFPDTYDFYVGESVDNVARKFLTNFNSKMTQTLKTRMLELNMTLDETITLASIIQKEAGHPDEMKRVSSVFHNRMDLTGTYPKLQSDVTIHYVNNFIKPFQDLVNQDMYDAYNTYVCDGLPVGPICNPGLDAIEAALYPEETNNYFFVTDVQEQYYYAETPEEHDENVRIASRVQGEGTMHGTDTQAE